jgi:type III pantothenate kinase
VRLLVDLGNSRIKWAQSAPGHWHSGVVTHRGADLTALLDQAWKNIEAPRTVIVSSVAAGAAREALGRWLKHHGLPTAHFIQAPVQQLGVTNRYREPAQLGPDRWAALVAARALTTTPVSVVDCGTAVTVDALSANGEFLGGAIFPGLELLRGSLAHGTAALGDAPGDASITQARRTADAIAAGTLFGLAGAIERLLDEHRAQLGAGMQVLLTGGDASSLSNRLRCPVREVPELVLQGLDRIADTL